MKKLMFLFTCMVVLSLCGLPAVCAEDDETAHDHIKIEKTTASGAKVTVVEGTSTQTGKKPVETTKESPIPEPTQAKSEPKVVQTPVDTAPHKARLAVLPAVIAKQFEPKIKIAETMQLTGNVDLKAVFSRENESRMEMPSLGASMVEAFTASRKFDVLERGRLNEVMKEVDFGQTDYADPSRVVPMGKALNAEYVVLPEIIAMEMVGEAKEAPYVDRPVIRLMAKMIARVRIADVAGTKVVAASTEEVRVERRPKATEPFKNTEIDSLVVDLYKTVSVRLLHRTLEAIYPLRILDVKGATAVLNRGEGAISTNDVFAVFKLGKTYVDPDTKESLGAGEELVGKIKVSRVMPRTAEAEIIEGADKMSVSPAEFLCRETAESISAKTTLPKTLVNW
ncbi:MAG: hypothetical protein FJ279_14865 [Planctomycetes bacterium]|nr:hypothetical protein [Planctomycetota bacterium]